MLAQGKYKSLDIFIADMKSCLTLWQLLRTNDQHKLLLLLYIARIKQLKEISLLKHLVRAV